MFTTPTTAFHLNNRADISRSTIDEVSTKYGIPDLLQATDDFLSHFLLNQTTRTVAGKRGPDWNTSVPFDHVRVWYSIRIQTYNQSGPGVALPKKLFASPLTEDWPHGWCDTAIFAHDAIAGPLHPPLGLNGKPPYYFQYVRLL